ncbi:hypothetical protein ACX80V_05700 [Arthrobacter sp. MDT3-24]
MPNIPASAEQISASLDSAHAALGGSKLEQLQTNIAAAAQGPLPADVVAACDAVAAGIRGPMPNYNR